MLDILQMMVGNLGYQYLRMDGTTPVQHRMTMVHEFNTTPDIFVFLLTTKVGGLGLNLTGADRVILFDPDWVSKTYAWISLILIVHYLFDDWIPPIEPLYWYASPGKSMATRTEKGCDHLSTNDKRNDRRKDIPSADLQAIPDEQNLEGSKATAVFRREYTLIRVCVPALRTQMNDFVSWW